MVSEAWSLSVSQKNDMVSQIKDIRSLNVYYKVKVIA